MIKITRDDIKEEGWWWVVKEVCWYIQLYTWGFVRYWVRRLMRWVKNRRAKL